MIDLAQQDRSEYTALKDISRRQNISIKYLEQITALMSKFGLLLSSRGPQGGYRLAKEPYEYTVGEILRITEGDFASVACLTSSEESTGDDLATLKLWKDLSQLINDYLNGRTLQNLIDQAHEYEGPEYYI